MSFKFGAGPVAAVLAAFFIAAAIILTKVAGLSAQPLVIAGVGPLMSVPLLLLIQAFSKQPLELKRLLTQMPVPFTKVLLSRAVFGQALIVTGFTLTSGVKAVLLLRLEPVFVFAWSVLRGREQMHPKKLVLLALLLAGSYLVVAPTSAFGGPNLGDLLVVASLFFLSYSYLPTQEVVARVNPAGLNILTNFIGGLALSALALLLYSPAAFDLTPRTYAAIGAYSLVFFVIGASFYFYAFKTLKPWVISSFLSLEVVFGLALAAIVLHESMTVLQGLGAAIVLAASAVIGRLSRDG